MVGEIAMKKKTKITKEVAEKCLTIMYRHAMEEIPSLPDAELASLVRLSKPDSTLRYDDALRVEALARFIERTKR